MGGEMNLEEAFAEACQQIGALSVQLAAVTRERDQAAARIVELTPTEQD